MTILNTLINWSPKCHSRQSLDTSRNLSTSHPCKDYYFLISMKAIHSIDASRGWCSLFSSQDRHMSDPVILLYPSGLPKVLLSRYIYSWDARLKILLRSLRCVPPSSWSVWISWWNAFASSIFFFWLLPLAFQRSYSRCLVLVCYLHIVPLCTLDSLCFTLVYYPPYDPSLALGLCRFMSISLFE